MLGVDRSSVKCRRDIGVIDSLMQNASVCFDCRLAACVRVAGPNVRRRGILGADRSIRWRGSGTRVAGLSPSR